MKPLKTQLAEGKFSGAYLLYGEEDFLKDYYCHAIVSKTVDPALRDFNYLACGPKCDNAAIGAFLDAFPMMADQKTLVVRNAGLFQKPSAEDKDFWTATLKNLPDYAVVVFVEPAADKRSALFKTINNNYTAEEFKKQQKTDLMGWAQRILRSYGKTIEKADLELVIENTDSSMLQLKNELEKLCHYSGGNAKITHDAVARVTCRNAENRIFQMIDHIAAGRGAQAIAELNDLKTLKEQPVGIITLIARHYTILHKIKLLGAGTPPGDIAKQCGIPPFSVKKYLPMANALPAGVLRTALHLCRQADYAVKSGAHEGWLAVDLLVGRLLNLSGARR